MANDAGFDTAMQLLRDIAMMEPYDNDDYGNMRCAFCYSTDKEGHKDFCVHARAKAFIATFDLLHEVRV